MKENENSVKEKGLGGREKRENERRGKRGNDGLNNRWVLNVVIVRFFNESVKGIVWEKVVVKPK